jgi:hypothetical protein
MTHAPNPNDRGTQLKLVQVNFKNQPAPAAEQKTAVQHCARQIANVPGLIWKIWINNSAGGEEGGIYLFQDEPSAHAYLEGEIFTQLKNLVGIEALQVKLFDVNEANSAITRAMFISK